MRPHKVLGNYGHHAGLVPDRMPSGGGCIRLVSTGPPRNHADFRRSGYRIALTLTQSARKEE